MAENEKSERDTHFAGAAELLVLKMDGLSVRYKDWPDWRELDKQVKQLIAHFAYDLVFSGLKQYPLTDEEAHRHIARNFPDLTEWPKPLP